MPISKETEDLVYHILFQIAGPLALDEDLSRHYLDRDPQTVISLPATVEFLTQVRDTFIRLTEETGRPSLDELRSQIKKSGDST